MTLKNVLFAICFSPIVSPLFAAPTLTVTPGGNQGGNWVWDVSVTPDLALAGGSTPLAVELGFRLTNAPLFNVTNVNPTQFDSNNPGNVIFGWETLYPPANKPEGIEINCTGCTLVNTAPFGGNASTIVAGSANEIFSAMGSVVFNTAGAKPFLKIIARGPASGFNTSTIQWLGAYNGMGRIAQAVGATATNFDTFSGTATQTVPEPAAALLALSALGGMFAVARRRSACAV